MISRCYCDHNGTVAAVIVSEMFSYSHAECEPAQINLLAVIMTHTKYTSYTHKPHTYTHTDTHTHTGTHTDTHTVIIMR